MDAVSLFFFFYERHLLSSCKFVKKVQDIGNFDNYGKNVGFGMFLVREKLRNVKRVKKSRKINGFLTLGTVVDWVNKKRAFNSFDLKNNRAQDQDFVCSVITRRSRKLNLFLGKHSLLI